MFNQKSVVMRRPGTYTTSDVYAIDTTLQVTIAGFFNSTSRIISCGTELVA
jgi:hypothetical protein